MTTKDTIFNRIRSNKAGWVFSNKDFSDLFPQKNIDTALFRLLDKGEIRRICRGIYDRPRYKDFLKELIAPDIEQVAKAIARRSAWKIFPSGDTALNMLGVSTQVPSKISYISDGPQRTTTYDALGTIIEIKRASLKDISFKYYETGLIVQAIKMLGKNQITDTVINKIKANFPKDKLKDILQDSKYTTSWIRDCIKKF